MVSGEPAGRLARLRLERGNGRGDRGARLALPLSEQDESASAQWRAVADRAHSSVNRAGPRVPPELARVLRFAGGCVTSGDGALRPLQSEVPRHQGDATDKA